MNTDNDTQKFICERCGKEHNGSYGSGRFCCQHCKQSYVTALSNKSDKRKHKYICPKCHKEYISGQGRKTELCNDCYRSQKVLTDKINFE